MFFREFFWLDLLTEGRKGGWGCGGLRGWIASAGMTWNAPARGWRHCWVNKLSSYTRDVGGDGPVTRYIHFFVVFTYLKRSKIGPLHPLKKRNYQTNIKTNWIGGETWVKWPLPDSLSSKSSLDHVTHFLTDTAWMDLNTAPRLSL